MDKTEIYATLNEAYFSSTPAEQQILDRLPLLVGDAKIVVDAGASLGQYTQAISRLVTGGEIHAIEADPVRFEELERNCATWSAESGNQVTAHHAALTDRSGTTSYYVTNSDISGGLTKHDTQREVGWEEITTPALSLDDLFAGKPAPDFIKIDVEGAELGVLRGAQNILARGAPVVFLELHRWGEPDAVLALMRSLGYRHALLHDHHVFVKSASVWARVLAASPRDALREAKSRFGRLAHQ